MKRDWEDDFGDGRRFAPDDVICPGDADGLRKAGKAKHAVNRAHYDSMRNMVCYMGKMVPSNPEYRARAENTKKLREQLKSYSGSRELASDLLFQTKKLADEQGLDFGIAAQREIDAMKGFGIVGPQMNEVWVPKPEPKKPIASRIKHWLWKHGLFPSHLITKEDLSVEEADKCL